jgi:hypothetical protein
MLMDPDHFGFSVFSIVTGSKRVSSSPPLKNLFPTAEILEDFNIFEGRWGWNLVTSDGTDYISTHGRTLNYLLGSRRSDPGSAEYRD